MLKNYISIAFRNLLRHRLFTGLNVFGLATGMTCSILIFLWVQDELSYDRFNEHADKIYRVTAKVGGDLEAAVVPPPLAAAIKAEIPPVKIATRIATIQKIVSVGTKKFDEKNIYFADTNFLKVFSYPLLSGNIATVLSAPGATVLTNATAIKYFGSAEKAMGKTVSIDHDAKGKNLIVTGVLKDIPRNSHLHFDMLLPIALYDKNYKPEDEWNNYDVYVYFQVADNFAATPVAVKQIEKQMDAIRKKNDKSNTEASLFMQPLTSIHLYSHYLVDVDGQGSSVYTTIFSIVALFILLIACINFMNLSTAQSSQRAKEVGLRKTIGAQRFQLIIQFMGESLLISFISLVVAILLAVLLLPLFNELASKSLSINLLSGRMVATLLSAAVLVGIISGSYPALFLSSFSPIKALKGGKILRGNRSFFRNGLVVLQFSISVILIVSTLVVYRQLQFIKNRDIGFNKENLVYVQMPQVGDLKTNEATLKAMLAEYPEINDYTVTDVLPINLANTTQFIWPAMDPKLQVFANRLGTDDHFIKTFGMHIVEGRFFSKDFKTDDSAYVVNETVLKVMNLNSANAIGNTITVNDRPGTIIGVVKDFNFKTLQHPVEPMIMRNDVASGAYLVVRTTPGNMQKIIADIKKAFGTVYVNYPFSYSFVNEDLSKLYIAERQMGKLFNLFSFLSIIISCLGLFGLATFATQKRIKEIGVRKVLGASEMGIVTMLSKDFITLVIIAMIVAFPVSWLVMNKWLENFTYRISLSWWIFVIAGAVAIIIAFITVSYQSVKAALANPVKSLRTE